MTEPQTENGPLVGMRVIDLGTTVAGPLTASLLGDFGADVIKVEYPGKGDTMRHWGPFKQGISLTWKVLARNKRLVTLNLKHPRGQDLARQMIADADVVVENFRPGTLEKWNLGYEDLRKINPGLVMVRVSGYGQDGPYAERPGYGTIAEAMTGIPSFTGFPEAPPTLSAWPLADAVAAVFGAWGAMMALYHRDHSGEGLGQIVDLSLYEPLFRLVESQVIGYDQLGLVKQRRGNRIEEDVPRNAYRTSDNEWIAISASSNRTFARLMRAIGRPELAEDPRFISNKKRIENEEILDDLLAGWFAERTLQEALAILENQDVIAGAVLTIEDIFRHPQYAARRNIIEVSDEHFNTVRMQGVVPKLSRTPGSVRFDGQELGRHNEEVYKGELGLSPEEMLELQAKGVI